MAFGEGVAWELMWVHVLAMASSQRHSLLFGGNVFIIITMAITTTAGAATSGPPSLTTLAGVNYNLPLTRSNISEWEALRWAMVLNTPSVFVAQHQAARTTSLDPLTK